MLEKLGIRLTISVIIMWYILQLSILKVNMDFHLLTMLVIHACFMTIIIEAGIGILRHSLRFTPIFLFCFLVFIGLSYYYFKIGIYFGIILYILISISIDLLREYYMTSLLKKALRSCNE